MSNNPTENDLPFGRWVPFHSVLEALHQRQSVTDGGTFVLEHWQCKYIDIRLDMRIGMARLVPGSGPDSVYTKLAQVQHERDALVEQLAELRKYSTEACKELGCFCGDIEGEEKCSMCVLGQVLQAFDEPKQADVSAPKCPACPGADAHEIAACINHNGEKCHADPRTGNAGS